MRNDPKIKQIQEDFPVIQKGHADGHLIYLDNGATTQKSQAVIDSMTQFYQNDYATVHRGVYRLSQQATQRCEDVRKKVQSLLHANRPEEVIFCRGTTQAINMVAFGCVKPDLKPNDEILITEMEHHANIVPWQQVCEQTGARLVVAPISDKGELLLDDYKKLVNQRTKIVALTHVSNVLGTINDLSLYIPVAREVGAMILVDGAQAVAHQSVNVQELDVDFYCFSAHKMYGPTGIGILYGRYELLERMTPFEYGGDMIESVSFEKTSFAKPPLKFEAGTPSITEIIGLGAACEYLTELGFDWIEAHERQLKEAAHESCIKIEGLEIYGQSEHKAAVVSFNIKGIHPHDLGTILDEDHIAIRAGHHCAQPLMARLGVVATARASFGIYNTVDDIEAFIKGLHKAKDLFGL